MLMCFMRFVQVCSSSSYGLCNSDLHADWNAVFLTGSIMCNSRQIMVYFKSIYTPSRPKTYYHLEFFPWTDTGIIAMAVAV